MLTEGNHRKYPALTQEYPPFLRSHILQGIISFPDGK